MVEAGFSTNHISAYLTIILVTMVTDPILIEYDVGISCIHDAAGAYAIFDFHSYASRSIFSSSTLG